MANIAPVHLMKWIEEHKTLFSGPVANKEVFPDADVFPCILTARKPDAGPPPETVRVCVLPREQTRVDSLSRP